MDTHQKLFSDGRIFRMNKVVRKQNERIWGTNRPGIHSTVVMSSPSAMTYCVLSRKRTVGPFLKLRVSLERATEIC